MPAQRESSQVIFVDNRLGSVNLIAPLQRLGLDVEGTRLEFGDVAFEGRGEKGAVVSIGIEFKKLEEFVQALRTQRLQGHQLVGMRPMFDYSYLLIEGKLLYDRRGRLLKYGRGRRGRMSSVMPGNMSVLELLKRKNVLHLCGGLNPLWTVSREDTLQEILALYRTWTDQDLDKHKSHIAAYEAPALIPISDFRRTVKTFPHIGMRASLAVEQYFNGCLDVATHASVDKWAGIKTINDKGRTKRLGIRVAEQIVEFCKGSK